MKNSTLYRYNPLLLSPDAAVAGDDKKTEVKPDAKADEAKERKPKLTDEDFLTIVRAERLQAIGMDERDDILGDRIQALEYDPRRGPVVRAGRQKGRAHIGRQGQIPPPPKPTPPGVTV